MSQRQRYVRSVFGIFSKLLGSAQYVNAYAFSLMLEEFPTLVKPYFISYKTEQYLRHVSQLDADMFDRFKETVNNMLYMQFSSQYEFFKNNPEGFFDELSQMIVDVAREEMQTERIRYSMLRFLEIGLRKLIWSYEEPEDIWDNVKTITRQLGMLVENNILEDLNDLDDLYWTLVHRFNFFLDLNAAHLPVTFFENIKNDISANQLLLLDLEEQDICMQTKAECLHYSLLQAEAKSRAYAKGIMARS